VVGVPDGVGRHRAPDDTASDTASDTGGDAGGTEDPLDAGAEHEPGTPEEQVRQEIIAAQATGVLPSILGLDWEHEAGGGGTGGQFMFANLAELDGVIAAWQRECDGIRADGLAIEEAMKTVARPAQDLMSIGMTSTSKTSLAAMKSHCDAMLTYTEEYLAKLRASRTQMATTEDGALARVRGVQA
jgi:hypothetical protein